MLPDAVLSQLPEDLQATVRDIKAQFHRMVEKQQQLQQLQQELQFLQTLRVRTRSNVRVCVCVCVCFLLSLTHPFHNTPPPATCPWWLPVCP